MLVAFPYLFPTGAADQALLRLRVSSLKFLDQVQYLLRFYDSRFIRYDRFRYTYFNLQIQELSNSRARQIVNRRTGVRLTIKELRDTLRYDNSNADTLLNSVVRCSTNIKGIRLFQSRRRRELSTYVYALGKPTFFFTFSAADTQQQDLQKHLLGYKYQQTAPNNKRYTLNRTNIRLYPYVVTQHFNNRFRLFIEHVVRPKFYVKDQQYRYEFQGRSSTYVYSFVQYKDLPKT